MPPASALEPTPSPCPLCCSRSLLGVSVAFIGPQLIGSVFNIWYNLLHIEPLLTEAQLSRFQTAIFWVNIFLYPIAIAFGMSLIWSLRPTVNQVLNGGKVAPDRLHWAQSRTVNLPWWTLMIAGGGWLICIPIFTLVFMTAEELVNSRVYLHLPSSLLISGAIAVSIGFFCVELTVQRWLYPILFVMQQPHGISQTYPLSLSGRSVMWTLSACVAPICCMLLLTLEPESLQGRGQWFAIVVGALAIVFGLIGAAAFARQLLEPVHALRRVAQSVRQGNLQVHVDVLRADEFGPLIDTVNSMLGDLREKARVEELFGRHVGREAALKLLEQDPAAPAGVEQELTVLFADLRGFTAMAAGISAPAAVALLNEFFSEMVDVIEQTHGGMVNKFLGDGLMALFGAVDLSGNHADQAMLAAIEMHDRLQQMNLSRGNHKAAPLKMGIGIATGSAIVGSIGSQRRGEFTAIGTTVNLASRIESLTKELQAEVVFTASTQARLSPSVINRLDRRVREVGLTPIRGLPTAVDLFVISSPLPQQREVNNALSPALPA